MKYLLDVNVLVAWGWSDHVDHDRVDRWLAVKRSQTGDQLLTSSISELGFVRVSLQRVPRNFQVQQVSMVLREMLGTLGSSHAFLADNQRGFDLPRWCRGPAHTTDAHLWALAKRHKAQLATLDAGIPNAFLVP
jgi:predicted nucleic acid-binding protein